tara:strand:+ start:342 stop:608 length:267 start_codon:yes stop_codon:yes gene_type:complete
MKTKNNLSLAKFRTNASHKNCSNCGRLRPRVSFAPRKNTCLECRSERQLDYKNKREDEYKKAAGNCWWLERYFIIADQEISRIKKSYR